MAQKGDLMTVRSDIQILDATIRDGGLVNNFDFSEVSLAFLCGHNVQHCSLTRKTKSTL